MKRAILQGITHESNLSAVKHILELDSLERAIVSVAFVNKGGISLLREALKPVANLCTFLIGIRNGITTGQGIEASLELGCSTYVVDTGSRQLLFHPKIYMSRNSNEARLVVGSSNLTIAGLCTNVEASLLLELDLDEPDDRDLVHRLENQMDGMITEFPENVIRISSRGDIKGLLVSERVIDETLDSRPTSSDPRPRHDQDTVPKMKLKTSRSAGIASDETSNEDAALPKQVEFVIPLLAALRDLEGSGTNDEIFDRVVQQMQLTEDQLAVKDMNGRRSKVRNLLAFAKARLRIWRFIDGDDGRYWLTEKGRKEDVHDPQALMRSPY